MSVDFDENSSPMRILHPAEIAARDAHLARLSARAELRDRFAAAALSGMHAKNNYHPGISTPQERARLAYIDADAMMEEREKRSQVDMKARDHE